MLKRIFTVVPLAVLAMAAPAAAEGDRHAKSYKAHLTPVVAAPVAEAAERDESGEEKRGGKRAEGVRGKAHLVDGPRRDKVELHVRGLTGGESYSWSVRQVAPVAEAAGDETGGEDETDPEKETGAEDETDAEKETGAEHEPAAEAECGGEEVAAFSYEPLVARRHGHSKARARSKAFAAEEGATYVIVVTAADGTDVACGEFESKRSRKQAKAERKAAKKHATKHATKHAKD